MDAYTHICLLDGTVLSSNLPTELLSEYQKCDSVCECKMCPVTHKSKRHGKVITEKGVIYLCIYDTSVTNKIFNRHMELCNDLFNSIYEAQVSIRRNESNKIVRLEHNVVSYQKYIKDELDTIISDGHINYKDWRETKEAIKGGITDNMDSMVMSIFRILKYNKLINAEIDVFDIFEGGINKVTLQSHPIHKVVNLSMQAFWLDFVDKKCKINIGQCTNYVLIDYSSFSVVMGHIFDNATKYALDNTDININFEADSKTVTIVINMESVTVNPDELDKIFEEKYSGENAKKYGMDGYGIGMFYAKKLTELNEGEILFIAGPTKFCFNGIPYADNTIKIKLKRYIQ